MAKGVPGLAVGIIAAGGILAWSGVYNQSLTDTLSSLLKGSKPTPGPQAATNASVTTGSVPSGSSQYDSANALQKLWTSNGGDPRTAAFAAKVAMAESSGDANVTS